MGLNRTTIQHWCASGYLVEVLPRVYAVGHDAPSAEGDLWAAVLYAGSGAMLSHMTAAHWRKLIDYPPSEIHISTMHQVPSIPGIVIVHGRRTGLERFLYNGIPATSHTQTMLDLAAVGSRKAVLRALAQLDYRGLLDIPQLIAVTGKGRRGSVQLREAIAEHQPKLALVNGVFEFDWLLMLVEWGITPLPEIGQKVCGHKVDCHWPEHGYVVELDGVDAHASEAKMKEDRERDFEIRATGRIVHRYDWDLVHGRSDAVRSEIERTLKEREGWAQTNGALALNSARAPFDRRTTA